VTIAMPDAVGYCGEVGMPTNTHTTRKSSLSLVVAGTRCSAF